MIATNLAVGVALATHHETLALDRLALWRKVVDKVASRRLAMRLSAADGVSAHLGLAHLVVDHGLEKLRIGVFGYGWSSRSTHRGMALLDGHAHVARLRRDGEPEGREASETAYGIPDKEAKRVAAIGMTCIYGQRNEHSKLDWNARGGEGVHVSLVSHATHHTSSDM